MLKSGSKREYQYLLEHVEMGRKIRARREDMGLSQQQFCNRLALMGFEVAQPTYSPWELGKFGVPIPALKVIARALDVSANYLLGIEEAVWADPSVASLYNKLAPEQQDATRIVLRTMAQAADASRPQAADAGKEG